MKPGATFRGHDYHFPSDDTRARLPGRFLYNNKIKDFRDSWYLYFISLCILSTHIFFHSIYNGFFYFDSIENKTTKTINSTVDY